MDPFWDVFLWSAVPLAVLILAAAVGAYWLSHRRPRQREDAQARVARAYFDAQNQAAGEQHRSGLGSAGRRYS